MPDCDDGMTNGYPDQYWPGDPIKTYVTSPKIVNWLWPGDAISRGNDGLDNEQNAITWPYVDLSLMGSHSADTRAVPRKVLSL